MSPRWRPNKMAMNIAKHPYGRQEGFVELSPSDEQLHDDVPDADYTLSETSYLGFNIPEAGVNAEIYHWFHPRLGLMSGGLMIWQGHKTVTAEADYIDYRNFLPYPTGDISDVTYPSGVRIRVVEPLHLIAIDFESPDGSTRLELSSRAIMPAAGRADGKHFAQAMHNTGVLALNGEIFPIDSYFTRDRSWQSPRPEVSLDIPPLTWGGAVFGEDLALHFVAHDSPDLSDESLRWGYAYREGELRRLVRIRKLTTREDGLMTCAAELELEDSAGDVYPITATAEALLPMAFWPNMLTQLVLMRYELEGGRVAYGDYQDIVFGNFLRALESEATA